MYEERFKNSFSDFYASRETSVFRAYAVEEGFAGRSDDIFPESQLSLE